MPDLFSEVETIDPEPPGEERDDDGPCQPDELEPPTDAELEAQFYGRERAGVPWFSKSVQTVRARWRAVLDAQPPEQRAWLEGIEEQAFQDAVARKRMAREAEFPGAQKG